MATCIWCGEELKFERGKGWVHQDGKVYKQKLAYPRQCRRCSTALTDDGYCYRCGAQYQLEEVDDHCVLPKRS